MRSLDRLPPSVLRAIATVRGVVERLLAVRIVESSVVLAAQAFLALVPLLIIAYALLPSGAANSSLDQLRHRLGIGGGAASSVQQLIDSRSDLQSGLSAIGVIVVIGSATAFTRALQRVYQRAWELPKLGLRGMWRTVAWFGGLFCYLGIVGIVVSAVRDSEISIFITAVPAIGLWWWTPFILLGGRVRWRALLPGAILTSVAQLIAALVSRVVMPHEVRSNEATFGPIGVVFAVESWFIVLAGVLVAGAALGALMGMDDGPFGRWIRGTPDPDAWRRTPHIRKPRTEAEG